MRYHVKLRCAIVLAAAGLGLFVTGAQAKSHRPPAVKVYAPRFHALLNGELFGGDGLAFLETPTGPGALYGASPGTVVSVPPASAPCVQHASAVVVGGGHLVTNCGSVTMFSPGSPSWTAVDSAGLATLCGPNADPGECAPVAVGTQWIRIRAGGCDHCGTRYGLLSLQTGTVQPDPTGGNTIADLDALNPARKLCAPITTSAGGMVSFFGNRALIYRPGSRKYFIGRCGSSQQMPLNVDPTTGGTIIPNIATNAHVAIWYQGPGDLLQGFSGITDQAFEVRVPALGAKALVGTRNLALTATALFVQTPTRMLRATLPAAVNQAHAGAPK
jgi:hypothetical protein